MGDSRGAGHVGDVLIVDDEEVVRGLLAWLFEDAGYDVRQAVDGREALAELAVDPPACMVLDLMMPEVDGLEVLRRRQDDGLAPETRIIILTAKDSRADEVWCWEHGADEYLNKPFDGDRLFDDAGKLRRFVNVFVAEEDVRFLDGLDTAVTSGQTVSIIPAVAGG